MGSGYRIINHYAILALWRTMHWAGFSSGPKIMPLVSSSLPYVPHNCWQANWKILPSVQSSCSFPAVGIQGRFSNNPTKFHGEVFNFLLSSKCSVHASEAASMVVILNGIQVCSREKFQQAQPLLLHVSMQTFCLIMHWGNKCTKINLLSICRSGQLTTIDVPGA